MPVSSVPLALCPSPASLQIGQLSGGATAKVLPAKQACCAAALKFQGTEKATLNVRRPPSCFAGGDRDGKDVGPVVPALPQPARGAARAYALFSGQPVAAQQSLQ
jgi:uncharacterized protein YgbK (DUF1537 family)